MTAENQHEAARRVPLLSAIPAAIRFISAEPLLAPLDLRPWLCALSWIIVGGESSSRARPMDPAWARDLRDQTHAARGAFFFKQTGQNRALWPRVKSRHGTDPAEWPVDLRIPEFPTHRQDDPAAPSERR